MTFDYWTLGFQAVNVLVLIWLLHRFFWTPVSAMIAARQTTAAALLDQAQDERDEAEKAHAQVAKTRDGLTAEREAILAAAHKDALAARATVMAAAQAEVDALHDTAKAARLRAAQTLKETAVADAQNLAVTIAGQLAARLKGDAVDAAFLGWLVGAIAGLPDADRTALGQSDTLELISAAAPGPDAQRAITDALATAFGATPALTFRTDPTLIAGYELRSPHFTRRNSWAADLARIAAALAQSRAPVDEVKTDAA